MSHVFVSYAHEDGDFVDRLHRDLSAAGLPATYDKVVLEIGDSIVQKLSGLIHGAACVVGVVSSASLRSRWVQRELSWALSGELDGRPLKVLPAVIEPCELPPMLADKLFADFRGPYFPPLRALVRTIRNSLRDDRNEFEDASPVARYDRYLDDCQQLEHAMVRTDGAAVFRWIQAHPDVVASLVANPRDIVLADPGVSHAAPTDDMFVCWTPATQYLWHLVRLGPLVLTDPSADAVWALARELAGRAAERQALLPDYVRRCAMAEGAGKLGPLAEALDPSAAGATAPVDDMEPDAVYENLPRSVTDRLILLAGRRADHRGKLLDLRRRAKAELGVELKSYEWLLEALGGRHYRLGL